MSSSGLRRYHDCSSLYQFPRLDCPTGILFTHITSSPHPEGLSVAQCMDALCCGSGRAVQRHKPARCELCSQETDTKPISRVNTCFGPHPSNLRDIRSRRYQSISVRHNRLTRGHGSDWNGHNRLTDHCSPVPREVRRQENSIKIIPLDCSQQTSFITVL